MNRELIDKLFSEATISVVEDIPDNLPISQEWIERLIRYKFTELIVEQTLSVIKNIEEHNIDLSCIGESYYSDGWVEASSRCSDDVLKLFQMKDKS